MKFRRIRKEELEIIKRCLIKDFGVGSEFFEFLKRKVVIVSSGRKEVFITNKKVYDILKKIGEVYIAGLYIGEIKRKKFIPSLELAYILKKYAKNLIYVNEKSEQLFLYGRDVFREGIIEIRGESGRCIVLNKFGDVLGIGEFRNNIVKNLADRGLYLRKYG